jgi:hypothetical protein
VAQPGAEHAVRLSTHASCNLAIGAYPRFAYNAAGGGGTGVLLPAGSDGRQPLHFPTPELRIPPLNARTGRFLGLPLLPGLEISIQPQLLAGWLEPATGMVQLRFQAHFVFRAGSLYQAPPLWVDTLLTSAEPRSPEGELTLVGLAPVAPSGDRWFDRFLGLPSEALAILRCNLVWEP